MISSSPAGSHVGFDSGASLSGMTSSDMGSQGGFEAHAAPMANLAASNAGQGSSQMPSSISNSTISGLVGTIDHSNYEWPNAPPVPSTSALTLDATFGPEQVEDSDDADFETAIRQRPERKIPLVEHDPLVDWRYEMRREAQEIVPGLFVGPYQAGRTLESLQALGITHVVCIFEGREKLFVKPRFPDLVNYFPIEVRNAQDQNLIKLFPQVYAFTAQALSQGGKVLMQCSDGISRSPALVTAYVMCAFNVTAEEAYSHVQQRRFCAAPNQNFQRQIEAYENIHQATVAMAAYARQCAQNAANGQGSGSVWATVNRRKRGDAVDEDEDSSDVDEEVRERNLIAQRRRRGPEDELQHQTLGDQAMDTS